MGQTAKLRHFIPSRADFPHFAWVIWRSRMKGPSAGRP